MLARLKAILGAAPHEDKQAKFEQKQIAAAALLAEASCLDGHIDDKERETMIAAMQRFFNLGPEEAAHLVEEARAVHDGSTELHRFTRTFKDNFDYEDRVEMIEMLWEVAYADGRLHHYEDNLIRRIGGLLYVEDRDRGEAKKRVLKRLGL